MVIYNVYCDESCHLENDDMSVMVLGGVSFTYKPFSTHTAVYKG